MRVRLAAATAAMAALTLMLAGCGGDGEDDGDTGGGSSGGANSASPGHADQQGGTGRPLPPTEDTAVAVLPDAEALSGTPFLKPDQEATTGFCEQYEDQCATVRAHDEIAYFSEGQDEVAVFQLLAHDDAADATATMGRVERSLTGDGARPGPLFPDGEDGTSLQVKEDGELASYVTIIRQGPYLGLVTQAGPPAALRNTALGSAMNSMFALHMTQAEAGEQPTGTMGL